VDVNSRDAETENEREKVKKNEDFFDDMVEEADARRKDKF
jgi:hypothetical protein